MSLKNAVISAVKERRKFGNPLKGPKVKPFEVLVEFTATKQNIERILNSETFPEIDPLPVTGD